MAEYSYDVVVIGTGPAGESAAMNAGKKGKTVALIDSRAEVGGGCTHKGTIPSKALRHAVHAVMKFNRTPLFRAIAEPTLLSFPEVNASAQQVISKQVSMRRRFYSRNHFKIFNGHARFVDPNTVEVQTSQSTKDILHAEHVVIATGSRPYRPDNVDFSHPMVFDSDTILTLNRTPRRIIIYGAGVIGCEYASIFNGLGCKVDLVNPGARLLAYMDDEISDALSYHMRGHGVLIRHNEMFESLHGYDDYVELKLQSGKVIKADAFLWANGRAGNTDDLGLENAGLEANSRGQLEVDRFYRTKTDNIFAVGDVIGAPSLASAAYDQGRAASGAIVNDSSYIFFENIPNGIYTIPEISSVGKNERELTKAKIPYEVGKAYFKDTARAQITGEDVGVLKILFHRETLELLGIHCFGDQAAEILHIGQAIMEQKNGGNTLEYFVTHTFNYPTMAEAYRVAALNGLNRL
ncbi:Si-specific NAD(P)(+) transhydrogenase [Gynuella sunshinyii]|uniref:Soluble pyridine nucleotide transhydrogenase n=1 Tax=Gynuella sunshinyii YC6258 TaxID=1445510 RepID=A0A0C5VY60_9GAMM|nr:Si-specific NAD(P)(+) transhydrogenase [Gynuella sunshinyii]AJQ95309.1 pyruvate/2-oxoglutarate dehydrogenase complex, dihydrolipoamide dehydrogenase (E3) component,-related enzyme [Gynuella sunshinyii YC6258]